MKKNKVLVLDSIFQLDIIDIIRRAKFISYKGQLLILILKGGGIESVFHYPSLQIREDEFTKHIGINKTSNDQFFFEKGQKKINKISIIDSNVIQQSDPFYQEIGCMTLSKDEKKIYAGLIKKFVNDDARVAILDFESMKILNYLRTEGITINDLDDIVVSADNKYLLGLTKKALSLFVWGLETNSLLKVYDAPFFLRFSEIIGGSDTKPTSNIRIAPNSEFFGWAIQNQLFFHDFKSTQEILPPIHLETIILDFYFLTDNRILILTEFGHIFVYDVCDSEEKIREPIIDQSVKFHLVVKKKNKPPKTKDPVSFRYDSELIDKYKETKNWEMLWILFLMIKKKPSLFLNHPLKQPRFSMNAGFKQSDTKDRELLEQIVPILKDADYCELNIVEIQPVYIYLNEKLKFNFKLLNFENNPPDSSNLFIGNDSNNWSIYRDERIDNFEFYFFYGSPEEPFLLSWDASNYLQYLKYINFEKKLSDEQIDYYVRFRQNIFGIPILTETETPKLNFSQPQEVNVNLRLPSNDTISIRHDSIPPLNETKRNNGKDYHDYQKFGILWLLYVTQSGWGALLADPMGLGKTLQIIGYLHYRKVVLKDFRGPILIIAPLTILRQWKEDFEEWIPRQEHFKIINLADPKSKYQTQDLNREGLIILINYEKFRSRIPKKNLISSKPKHPFKSD